MMFDLKTNNLIHIFIQGLLLTYIGYMKNKTHKYVFYLLGLIALTIPAVVHLPNFQLNYWNMIAWLHYIGIMPLLLYIAYKQKLSKDSYQNLFIFGIIIIIYHSYKYYSRL